MRKLSFKEYLESKERLRKSIEESPVVSITYNIRKYCKLRIGESRNIRREISLKPTNAIIVEWCYNNKDDPKPISVIFDDVSPVEHRVYWSGKKLSEWLSKNTIEQF